MKPVRERGARRRMIRVIVTVGLAAGVLAVLAPGAGAVGTKHLYWSNAGDGSIGRAAVDGTHIDQDFVAGAEAWDGVAVDDAHIYWTDSDSDAIGRSRLDGSRANPTFITTDDFPDQVLVTATHVYWSNYNVGTIGRAKIDGTHVKQDFITGATNPSGIAVNRDHIYWTSYTGTTIGRAKIDGTHVNQAFIDGASAPGDIVVNKTQHLLGELRRHHDRARPHRRHPCEAGRSSPVATDRTDWRSAPPVSSGRTTTTPRSGAPTSTALA